MPNWNLWVISANMIEPSWFTCSFITKISFQPYVQDVWAIEATPAIEEISTEEDSVEDPAYHKSSS